VNFAQRLHRLDMRMRLGLLQDPAVIDRQIAKEVADAEAKRRKSQIPTVKTEAETKAEEAMTTKEKEAIKKKAEAAHKPPRIRPLSEAKAIETGANFVAETFIFSVGIGVIIFEQWRQRRKQQSQRSGMEEQMETLQSELEKVKAELEHIRASQAPPPAPSTRLAFWKAKSDKQPSQGQEGTTVQPKDHNSSSPIPDQSQSRASPNMK
jgi:optic atrophy 3 protein